MNFNEGFNLGASRPEAPEAEIDFTEDEREELVDPSEEQELEISAQEKANAILEEEELEVAAEAAAREQRLKEAIEMERENFKEAAAAEEKRILDKLYTDTPEEKFAEIGPQRAGHLWQEYYRNKKAGQDKEEERKNKQKRKKKQLIAG